MALEIVKEPYVRAPEFDLGPDIPRSANTAGAGASYDQEVRQRMAEMAKRRAAGATVPPVGSVPPASGAPVAAAAKGFGARLLPGIGTAIGIGGEAMGVADTVADPTATKIDVATRVAEGAGRLGAAGAGAAGGAMLGSAAGPVGTLLGGALGGTAGYLLPNLFYRNRQPAVAGPFAPTPVPALKAAVPRQPVDQSLLTDQIGMVPPTTATNALPPVAPQTAATITEGTDVPVFGTGGAVNTRTGKVMNFDSRAAIAAAPAPARTSAGGWAGAMGRGHGAALKLRQIASDNTRAAATAKANQDFAIKLPGAIKDSAEAANVQARTAAANAHLAANPTDHAGAAAIAAGRAPAADVYSGYPGMDGKTVDVLSKRTGAVQRVTPTVPPTTLTFAQAKAQAMKNPQYKYTDDATLRRDLAASGKYKITD